MTRALIGNLRRQLFAGRDGGPGTLEFIVTDNASGPNLACETRARHGTDTRRRHAEGRTRPSLEAWTATAPAAAQPDQRLLRLTGRGQRAAERRRAGRGHPSSLSMAVVG